MNEKYTYSFDELCKLFAKDKDIPSGDYHFDITFNRNDEEKIIVFETSPPTGKGFANSESNE